MLSRRCVAILLLVPLVLMGFAWGTPLALRALQPAVETPTITSGSTPDGAQVFAQQCAYCHGANGDGRGSVVLNPPARYFGRDKFKFGTTTANTARESIPSDDDLLRLLHRGIPGSAMPSFDSLPREVKLAAIERVRHLARQGLVDRQVEKARKNDDDLEPEKFAGTAAAQSVVGPALAIPAIAPGTLEAAGRGKLVYVKLCASCHGPEGKGDGPQVKDLKNDDGTPNTPRDLTRGLYKAGGEPEQLYARIMLGIPGTPMPASNTQPQAEIFDLIAYLRSLPQASAAPVPGP